MRTDALPSDRRLQSIDILRGVAILLVLAVHIPHYAPGGWRQNPWFFPAFLAEFGYLGVPLFIIISGFCIHRSAAMAYASLGHHRFNWRQFWVRRFIRLYPPYAVAIAFSLIAAFWLHSHFPNPRAFLGWDLTTHLLLVHNLTAEFATSLGNGAFWSLGTEEQLYALYFLLLALLMRGSARTAIAWVAAVTVFWRLLGPHLPELGPDLGGFHLGKWYQWPLHYWLHWALGALAVEAYFGNRKLPGWCRSLAIAALMLAIGVALNRHTFDLLMDSKLPLSAMRNAGEPALSTVHNLGELAILLGFFCLLNWSLARERTAAVRGGLAAMTAWIGRISYSLYLVHMPIIFVLEERLPLGDGPFAWPLRYLIYGAVVMIAGYVFHQSVERWFLHGRLPQWRPRNSLAGEQG